MERCAGAADINVNPKDESDQGVRSAVAPVRILHRREANRRDLFAARPARFLLGDTVKHDGQALTDLEVLVMKSCASEMIPERLCSSSAGLSVTSSTSVPRRLFQEIALK